MEHSLLFKLSDKRRDKEFRKKDTVC